MNDRAQSKTYVCVVLFVSLLIACLLGVALWDINFWPTDAKAYYFDAATQLSQLKYLSQIHETIATERVYWLHGKEIFIFSISLMQRLINDFTTLRPLILVCIFSICFSSVLIYFIVRKYWGNFVGFICWLLFTTSMWPYIYILFAKHQPLGLLFFLIALFLLQHSHQNKIGKLFCFFSGISMGLALFSSTVASLYLPYFLAAFIYNEMVIAGSQRKLQKVTFQILTSGALLGLGLLSVVVYVNFPHVIQNIKNYLEYVDVSGSYNHFFYNQAFLQQWFSDMDVGTVRGGWLWIIKYFFIIMPVMMPLYLVSLGYLVVKFMRGGSAQDKTIILSVILLSASSPLMAEIAQVAQYGANYFPSIIGIILVIGYGIYRIKQDEWPRLQNQKQKVILTAIGVVLIGAHIGINVHTFLTDIYPCRMVTTRLSEKFKELNIRKIYTHMYNPQHANFTLYLNPEILKGLEFIRIKHVIQPREGYILIPPITGDSIYIASISRYRDFYMDVFLNELVRKGNLKDYVVASYPTLASSRIWLHEEEILSYRRLILNHPLPVRGLKSQALLLDAKKVYQDMEKNIPRKDYLELFQKDISNIGTKTKVYMFGGYTAKFDEPKTLVNLIARVYKVGDPKDSLKVYVYRVDQEQVVWVRYSDDFASKPLAGEDISNNPEKGLGVFKFWPPLKLTDKNYFFLLYRTGEPDDENFYRIYNNSFGIP